MKNTPENLCNISDIWGSSGSDVYAGTERGLILHYDGPAAVDYTLTTTVDPAGSGTVKLDPSGGTYPAGTTVTLTANPTAGYAFDHWSGDLSGNVNPAAIIMNANKNVTAHFVAAGPSVVTPMVAAGWYHTVGLKSDGTVVAVGNNSYGQCNVGGWTDIVQVAAGAVHTVGLKSDGTVVAVGDNSSGQCNVGGWNLGAAVPPIKYDLIISSTAGGSVIEPGEGTFTYDAGKVVNLVAEADEGYRFVNWTGDVDTIADVNAATTTITMDADKNVTAHFVAAGPQPDVNNDGQVNVLDMVLIGQKWGQTGDPGWIKEDVNRDGKIDVLDLILVGQHWTG